jgi:hypothetical protein
MNRAIVVTPWVGDGTPGNSYRPEIADTYDLNWTDITGQDDQTQIIPDPNAYTIEVICDDTMLNTLESSNYIVLWSEEIVVPDLPGVS